MYIWPSHFPAQCPPAQAAEVSGSIYRFINGRAPLSKDFLSHYERDPGKEWGNTECNARGLSVLRSIEDCAQMRKGVPAMRKKRIAVGTLSGGVGLIAKTPSNTCEGHCTWWRSGPPEEICGLFAAVPEPEEK
jgi:hypothetical protein